MEILMSYLFGRGKLFGQFGSPRSALGLGVLSIFILLFVYCAVLGGIWWYAALAVLAPMVMWVVLLDAHRVPQIEAAALPQAPARDWEAYARLYTSDRTAADWTALKVLMDEDSSGGLDLTPEEVEDMRAFITHMAESMDRCLRSRPAPLREGGAPPSAS